MARDVTWRPSRRPPPRLKGRTQGWILLALLAANAAVILYHGDPRDRMPSAHAKSRAPEPKPAAAAVDEPAAAEKAAATEEAPAANPPPAGEQATAREAGEPMAAVAPFELAGPPIELAGFAAAADARAVLAAMSSPSLRSSLDPTAGLRSGARVQRVETLKLKRGQTVAAAVMAAGADGDAVAGALESLKELVSFRRLQPGKTLKARFDGMERLVSLEIHSSTLERARTDLESNGWNGRALEVRVDTVQAQVTGTVETSLWNALVGRGERAHLVTEVVDVFAWDIDFYREVYPGDSFRILVDKRYVEGEFVGYGPVHAAEFVSAGHVVRGYRYERVDGTSGYFDARGRSLRKQLLKSPMKYGSVTSGFGRRRHPILGYNRAHNGVDYGVPTGTPVWTVGDGRVMKAGWHGGFGKYIEVRHANGWLSQYAHLSKILVKVGQRVSQKDYIGKVGSTGMSTGPHLHYGLKRHGKYVNPASQKFERGKSLAGEDLQRFQNEVERLSAALDRMHVARDLQANDQQEG